MDDESKTTASLKNELADLHQRFAEISLRNAELEASEIQHSRNEHRLRERLNELELKVKSLSSGVDGIKISESVDIPEELRLQRDLALALGSSNDLVETMNQMLAVIFKIEGVSCGCVYLCSNHNGDLKLITHKGLSRRFAESVSRFAADSPNSMLIMEGNPDYQNISRYPSKVREIAQLEGIRAIALIPVSYQGQVVGILNLGSQSFDEIPVFSRKLLEAITDQIACAIARVKAEKALRGLEELFSNTFRSSPSVMAISSLEKGRFIDVNESFSRILGYGREEVIGRTAKELKLFATAEDSGELLQMLKKEKSLYNLKINVRDKMGAVHTGLFSLELIEMEGKPCLLSVMKDITEQARAEKALRESEIKFRELVETSSDWIWEVDTKGVYTYVSPQVEAMLGYKPEEIIGKTPFDLMPSEEALQVAEAFNHNREKGDAIVALENVCLKKDGSRVVIETSGIPVLDGEENIIGYRGVDRDITERKRVEEELARYRDHLEDLVKKRTQEQKELISLFDLTIDMICTADINGCFRSLNKAWETTLGYTKDELLSKPYIDLVHPDDVASTIAEGDKLSQGKMTLYFENRFRCRDGSYKWLAWTSSPNPDTGITFAVARDITGKKQLEDALTAARDNLEKRVAERTEELVEANRRLGMEVLERKQTEEKLRDLRNYLSNIINSMPSVLVGVDLESGITQWNIEAERVTGVSAAEAVGHPLADAFPRLAAEMDRVCEAIQTRTVCTDRRQFRLEDGETGYEDMTIYPLLTNGAEGAVVRIDNVTDQVRMEEMIIQSEKMLSVGGLAAGMAHEINNPLAAMLQTVDVMSRRLTNFDISANKQVAEEIGISLAAIQSYMEKRDIIGMLGRLRESGQRVAEIVANMLSFARKGGSERSIHSMAELLDQTVDLASSDYDLKKKFDFKQIEIKREYEEYLPEVFCESGKIQQVFLNILRNGAEVMWEETETRGDKNPCFTLRLAYEKETAKILIEIEDNGSGMDEATRKRVFEPFFTTKPPDKGTGLGLSVSYFIITENHDGEMSVQSAPGEGTRFIIRLPAASNVS